AVGGEVDDGRVNPFFEPGRGFGSEPQAARCPVDRTRSEPGHLQEDVGGFRTDLRTGAAHDAGDALGTVLPVDYQEVLGGQRTFGAVEGGDPLPLASVPHPEARTSQAGQIVGVVRLPQLEHHVVGDVDDNVYRSHPELDQAVPEP